MSTADLPPAPEDAPAVPPGNQPPPRNVLCRFADGSTAVTTLIACENTPGATVLAKQSPPDLTEALVPYTTPSGIEVIGQYDHMLKDQGTLLQLTEPPGPPPAPAPVQDPVQDPAYPPPPAAPAPPEFFICRLPSGNSVVATREECQQDGGTLISKLVGRTTRHVS